MNTKQIDQLLEFLAAKHSPDQVLSDEILHEIARDPLALEELAALSTELTGEVSTLLADIAHLAAEQTDLELLSAYVEAQIAGREAALLYPTIARRIQEDASFQMEYESLLTLLQAERQGRFGPAPSVASFVALQQQIAPTATEGMPLSALWQEVATSVQRFLITIPILVDKNTARFGQLSAPLTPALVTTGVYRTRPNPLDREKYVEVLTLPSRPGLNFALQVLLGPVEAGRITLLLLVNMLTPPQPIAQAKVLLRDADGNLLESVATDEQGAAPFEGLELGAYQFEVDYNGQAEQVNIALMPQNA